MSVRFEIAELLTLTSPYPAFWILRRSTEAPIAEDPMPASQANTMLWIGPALVPTRADATLDFLPFIDSIDAVAAARSSSSPPLSVLSSSPATAKDTAAAPNTDSVTPMKLSPGVWA